MKNGDWKPEIISRFWDYVGKQPHQQDVCFSKMVGKGILQFLIESGTISSGKIALDFGCGPGFLIEHLLSQGIKCYGVDSSPEQIELINKKMLGIENWKGATEAFSPPLSFEDSKFDLILCIEVIEHLIPEMRDAIVLEIHRLLKPGGRAFFTTPNNEDLDRHMVYCPFCETSFHRRQHISSMNSKDLHPLFETLGFNVVFCESLDLGALQSPYGNITWKSWNYYVFTRLLSILKGRFIDLIIPKSFPHGRAFRTISKCGASAPHLCILVEKP